MTQDERDILDTYAYAVSEVLPFIGCSTFHPERQTTLSCGMCPACRIHQRQTQVENIAHGVGYIVMTATTGPQSVPEGYETPKRVTIHTDPTVGRWPDHEAGTRTDCDMCVSPAAVMTAPRR